MFTFYQPLSKFPGTGLGNGAHEQNMRTEICSPTGVSLLAGLSRDFGGRYRVDPPVMNVYIRVFSDNCHIVFILPIVFSDPSCNVLCTAFSDNRPIISTHNTVFYPPSSPVMNAHIRAFSDNRSIIFTDTIIFFRSSPHRSACNERTHPSVKCNFWAPNIRQRHACEVAPLDQTTR